MYKQSYQKSHKKHRSREEKFQRLLQQLPFLKDITFTKEVWLIIFFCFLFGVLALRLFQLQVIKHSEYDGRLNRQHTRSTSVRANRGDIYAVDKSGQPVKLTENLTLYDIALDLTMIGETTGGVLMKPRLIELITPVVYKHFCEINGMNQVTPEKCITNLETFAGIELLPKLPDLFYYGSGVRSPAYDTFDFTGFDERRIQIISGFTQDKAFDIISTRLDQRIQI